MRPGQAQDPHSSTAPAGEAEVSFELLKGCAPPSPGSYLLGCSLCFTSRYLSVAMKDCAWNPRAVPATTGVWQMALSVPMVTTLLLRGVPTWPALSTALATQRTWNRRLK